MEIASFSSWLLILVMFVPRRILTVHHRNEIKLTIIGTSQDLLDVIAVGFIDDIQWASYHKLQNKVVVKAAWISEALGINSTEEMKQSLIYHDGDFKSFIHDLTKDIKTGKNHTAQIHVVCELDGNIQLSAYLRCGLDGENLIQTDEQEGKTTELSHKAYNLKNIFNLTVWNDMRKNYFEKYCFGIMKKILRNSSMKEYVPPEVYVSRYDYPNGTINFSCTATGFYPQSILMYWKKGVDGVNWGTESSSGTLPNSDDTFYLQISLKIQPGDPWTDYSCVVDHNQLQTPAVYPGECLIKVPEKPSGRNLWAVALSILIVILVISYFIVFIKWIKRKSGTTSQA